MYGCCGASKISGTGPVSTCLARVHHDDALRGLGDDREIVRDQHQRHAALPLQPQQQVEDLRLDGHVERGRRLVGDQQARIAGDRHRDHHALRHAAGQLVRKRVEARCGIGNLDLLQQLERARAAQPGAAALLGRAVQAQHFFSWKATV